MRKWLAVLLTLVLVMSLAGCGSKTETTDNGSTDNSSTSSTSTDNSSTDNDTAGGTLSVADQAIADRKASGDAPTVVMAFMNWAGSPAGVERIEGLISDYTMEKLGVKVKLEIFDFASYSQGLTLMLSSGEHVDIFSPISLGYTSSINKGYTLDLEEDNLIQDYGTGILETLNNAYIQACRVGGVLYGLPQQRDMAIGTGGFAIGKEYLDKIGFDYASLVPDGEEVAYTDIATIDSIFAQLKEAYPDKYVFAPQEATLTQANMYDNLGSDNFGVLLDPMNSLTVEDLWSSDMLKNFAELIYSWNQKGYISKDALTDDTAATAQVKAGTTLAYATATKPGIRAQETGLCGREMVVFQTGDNFLRSGSITAMPWSINSGSDDPVAAMQVLNLFYTDAYMSNLLCWGEEGKEYKVTDDGHITFADGIDAQNSEYFNNVNWLMPNQFIAHIWDGNDLKIWDKMEVFNNNAITSKALGFAFDNSSVATEYTALTNVYNEYGKILIFGFMDPAVGIPDMVAKLKASGLDKYMAEKQKALDEWASVNGIK